MTEPTYKTYIFDDSDDDEEFHLICVELGKNPWNIGASRPKGSNIPLCYFSIGAYSLPKDKKEERIVYLKGESLETLLSNPYETPEQVFDFGRLCDYEFKFGTF